MLPRYSSWLGRGTRPPYFPLLDALGDSISASTTLRFTSDLDPHFVSGPAPVYPPAGSNWGFHLTGKNDSTPSCRIYIADAQARDEICTCIVQSAMRRS